MTSLMDRMTRMEEDMVTKDEMLRRMKDDMETKDQRIAVLEAALNDKDDRTYHCNRGYICLPMCLERSLGSLQLDHHLRQTF